MTSGNDLFAPQRVGLQHISRLNGYAMQKTIGKGNFAVVKLATHTLTNSQAVDSKKKSGHGRVIYCYFELYVCEKIWGGSPATELIVSGIETAAVNEEEDYIEELGWDESSTPAGNVATPQAAAHPHIFFPRARLSFWILVF